jgi:hypothetical protein
VSYSIANDRTTVPLHLEPWGTAFVVFRKPAQQTSRTLPPSTETPIKAIDGPWDVTFQPGRGAPSNLTLPQLISWTDSTDKGVKYFSGTGTYMKTLQASPDWFKPGTRLSLDLGDVQELAEVIVNGKSMGVLWHAPFRVDTTDALRPGDNQIVVKVTNAWVNRMIGDEQPDSTTKYTFADVKPYRTDSPLLPSGMLGPVKLVQASQ